MKNLQEATERICELKGGLVALDALMPAVIDALGAPARSRLTASFDAHTEAARTVMLHADISETVLAAFERDVVRIRAVLQRDAKSDDLPAAEAPKALPRAVDPLLLTTTRVSTFNGSNVLTSASGFFFQRGERLFLVSNRHVFEDAASQHFPDRIEIGLHTDATDLTQQYVLSLPLFRDGLRQWREAPGAGSEIDVVAMEIPEAWLPPDAVFQAFDETHLDVRDEEVTIGDPLTIVGFPLGFHDTVHHLAVARGASIASAFGVNFQRDACFLTDARTHSGSSGSPVVRRRARDESAPSSPSWLLLGVHSTRMDMRTRDRAQDESLGLNLAWYAGVLLTLTAEA